VFNNKYKELSPELQGVEPPTDPFQAVPSNRLEAALQYTCAGLKIFPCRPNEKVPGTAHGFKDASSVLQLPDELRLKDLGWYDFILPNGSKLTVTPGENWAIEPGPFGFAVVDIDPKNGGAETWAALRAKYGRTITRMVRTPSGGLHLWFRGTIAAVNKKLGPGIDTRCFGGYVLLPPSSIDGRRYEWINTNVAIAPLPDWMREITEAQNECAKAPQEDDAAFYEWKATGGEGGGFEYRLSRIGDEASGAMGSTTRWSAQPVMACTSAWPSTKLSRALRKRR